MSKMNELSIDHDAYEAYVESERMDLRREGAEELRIEVLRELDQQVRKAWTQDAKLAFEAAKIVVERATI